MRERQRIGNYIGLMIGYMIVLAMVIASAPSHAADGPTRLNNESFVRIESLGQGMSQFGLDDQGTLNDRDWWVDARFLGGFAYALENMTLEFELEAWTGQLTGDTTSVGTLRGEDTFQSRRDQGVQWYAILPQRLSMSYATDVGVIRLGHQTYNWGLGLLVQDGRQPRDFGLAMRNNLVERIAFGTKPFNSLKAAPQWLRDATGFIAADVVFRDDNASLLAGDVAASGVLGFKIEEDTWSAGLIESLRFQRDRDDADFPLEDPSTLQVLTSDVYAKLPLWTQNNRVKLSLETEAAFIYGQTNRPYLDETFEDGATIQAFGAVARLNYAPTESLNLKFEGGYASGDQDARDDVYRVFTFHSDYQIGMVLFDQVMPMLTARSVDRIHDPELIQQAPASTRFLVNQGALRNARYLYPVIGYRPIEGLELKLAYLMAFSAAGAIDPFQSGINGGYNLGFDGKPTMSKNLGQELCLGVRYTVNASNGLKTTLIAEGGVLAPGAALSSVINDNVSLARAGFSLSW